jgi:hypothetical protein
MNSGATIQEYKTLSTGTTGTDFAIAHSAGGIAFNLPDAGTSARGAVTTGAQNIAGVKTFGSTPIAPGLTLNSSTSSILTNSSDGSDNKTLNLCSGGACSSSRGGYITSFGNENGVLPGALALVSGDVSGGAIYFYTGSSATERWLIANGGDLLPGTTLARSIGSATKEVNDVFAGTVRPSSTLIFRAAAAGIRFTKSDITAAGSTQGTATAIVGVLSFVDGADGTKGVILPDSPSAGDIYLVYNYVNAALKMYPGSGDSISQLGANNPATIAAQGSALCFAYSGSQWICGELSAI